jgi:hypothetical protein
MTFRPLRHPDTPRSGDPAHPRVLGHASLVLLERYLDGQLDERERRVFEKSLATDPVLREHLELQTRIDSSLKRHLSPSAQFVLEHPVETPPATSSASLRGQRSGGRGKERSPAQVSWLRIAAVVAIVMSGYLLYMNVISPWRMNQPRIAARITPAAAYAREVQDGMQPYAVCTTSEAFAEFTRDRLGTALEIGPVEGLTLIGWNYTHRVFSNDTITMLATYIDQPVVILMDHAEHAGAPGCSGEFDEESRTVGGIFLHEVRPKGVPSLLAHFAIAK